MDLTIFKNERQIKKSIQITVTKTKIESKLREDLQKSKDNLDNFNYLGHLDFYISQTISPTSKQAFERMAEVEYGITLKIIDAKKLAGNLQDFPSIKRTIKEIYEYNDSESLFKLSKKNKVIFNVIASGEDSTKIKRHLLRAYIISNIFEKNEIELTPLYNDIKEVISLNLTEEVLFNEINYLKSKGNIIGSSKFSLSEETQKKLEDLLDLNNIQEKQLTESLEIVLNKYGIYDKANEISRKLIEMYIQHFDFDIDEFDSQQSSFNKSSRKVFDELCALLKKSGIKEANQCNRTAQEIIHVTSSNEFLTKIGASTMYVKLYNSNKLESYINTTKRSICLDTQVLLRLLCNAYNPNTNDPSLLAIDKFISAIDESKLNMYFFTTYEYIEEVTAHIQTALKIYNYIKLPLFEKVGQSSNVFYNYFKEQELMGTTGSISFRKFVEDELLGIKLPDEFSSDFLKHGIKRMSALFETMGYYVVDPGFYGELQELQRDFEIKLSYDKKSRSRKAIVHDVRTAIYMSDENNHFDSNEELFLEPYLITWDSLFFDIRNIAKKKLKTYSPWFIYTPEKFIEKIFLGSFKIKPEAINETIISIVESDFNSSSSKKTFLDVISTIFNKEDVGKLKLAQKFVDLEEDFLDEKESADQFTNIISDESPVTIILGILIDYYNRAETENSMKDFTKLLENDSSADNVFALITDSITLLKNRKFNKEALLEAMDKLIKANV